MSSLAGSFLIARPTLKDSNFRHAVIFILQHDQQGACGLVVNRPAQVKGLPFPIFVGGPCESPGLFMLHGHAEWAEGAAEPEESEGGLENREVAPGIFLGDAASLERAKESEADTPLRFRLFRGYAGWGPGQLEGELAAGVWTVVPAKSQLLFASPVEELWDRLMPTTLPQPSVN